MYANIINVYEIYIYNIHQEYIDKKFKIKRTSESVVLTRKIL